SDNFTRDRPVRAKKFCSGASSGSGKHRLPACSFRQLAERLFERATSKLFLISSGSSASCRRLQAGSLRSPESKLPRCKHETLLSRLLFYVRKRFGGELLWCSQFHPHELAHAALFHRYTVQYVGLGDGAFVVRDDDELTLFYEPVQHADKAVDVAFVHCRIHFAVGTD